MLTDSAGAFSLMPPGPGEYFLLGERFGYAETRSPLFALGVVGRARIELSLVPEPIGLKGLEVSVGERAAEELAALGLSTAELGNRWIDRREIEAIHVKRDMGTIIERVAVPGMRVVRPENLVGGSDDLGLCISLDRARTGDGKSTCALIVMNGIPLNGLQAFDIDPESIESIAILTPLEAIFYYGTMGRTGAVLFWTQRGGS
jgi:hypothetical protein